MIKKTVKNYLVKHNENEKGVSFKRFKRNTDTEKLKMEEEEDSQCKAYERQCGTQLDTAPIRSAKICSKQKAQCKAYRPDSHTI